MNLKDSVKLLEELDEAIEFVNCYYPLPRCPHGNAVRDHAGDFLLPTCGCEHPEYKGNHNDN